MGAEKRGTPLGHPGTVGVPDSEKQKKPVGQLKCLAQKVFKQSVPLSHALRLGQWDTFSETGQKAGTPLGQCGTQALHTSMRHLEAQNIRIAVNDDADMRVVVSEDEANRAVTNGYIIYTPKDMYYDVQLEPAERRMLHEFKKRFAGTIEWNDLGETTR